VKEKGSVLIDIIDNEKPDTVRIRFINRGPAIPPEVIGQIFQFGFTTRPSSQGMGLAIAADMIVLHGGTISATSDIHKTVFEIVLPRIE
jgi:signal transduction histidine kinase